MTKREPLLTQDYFDNALAYKRTKIPEMEKKLAAHTGPLLNRARSSYDIFHKLYELPIFLYSAGAPLEEVRSAFDRVPDSWERYRKLAAEGYSESEKPTRPTFESSIDSYETALWMVSLCILFDVDDSAFARIVKLADDEGKANNEGQDQFYECLVSTRLPDRRKATRLIYPKPYSPLYEAATTGRSRASDLLKQFLKQWYPAMKDAYWHDNHKGPGGGGFFGYWALEAAAVVKAFHLDDTAFRNLPYFPKDLVAVRQ